MGILPTDMRPMHCCLCLQPQALPCFVTTNQTATMRNCSIRARQLQLFGLKCSLNEVEHCADCVRQVV